MMRLRLGKLAGSGGVPRVLADDESVRGNAMGQVQVLRGYTRSSPVPTTAMVAPWRQRWSPFQCPFMRCVHTQGWPRHDGQTGATQRGRKAGVFCAWAVGLRLPTHGEAAVAGKGLVLQQQRRAHEVQQQRRVFRVQQGLGMAQVAQAHDGAPSCGALGAAAIGRFAQGFQPWGIRATPWPAAAGTQSCSAASVC